MASKITIICRNPGMRRNGVVHPATATYVADRWSEAELAAFRADPAFEVVEGDVTDTSVASGLRAQITDLNAKLVSMTEERDKLASEKADLQTALDKANADLATATGEIAALKAAAEAAAGDGNGTAPEAEGGKKKTTK